MSLQNDCISHSLPIKLHNKGVQRSVYYLPRPFISDDDEWPSDDDSIPTVFPCSCSGACGEKFLCDEVTQQIYSLSKWKKNKRSFILGVDKTKNGKRKWTKYQFKGTPACRDVIKPV